MSVPRPHLLRGLAAGLLLGSCGKNTAPTGTDSQGWYSDGTWSGYTCFVAGTLISTPRGDMPIESLAAGDAVWAWDPDEPGLRLRTVAQVFQAVVPATYALSAGPVEIHGVSPEHPFWNPHTREWRTAEALEPGDLLWTEAGPVALETKALNVGKTTVYNLTVDGPEHTYFAEGALVHNKDGTYTYETGFPAVPVEGIHIAEVLSDGQRGGWDIAGTTEPCPDCLFSFEGLFELSTASDFGESFRAKVTWTNNRYVYGFNGDYWGYGSTDGAGYAYWAGYSTNGNYYYLGHVVY